MVYGNTKLGNRMFHIEIVKILFLRLKLKVYVYIECYILMNNIETRYSCLLSSGLSFAAYPAEKAMSSCEGTFHELDFHAGIPDAYN